MLFPALLLIAWVAETCGGPLEKGIHLRIPTPPEDSLQIRQGLIFGEPMSRSKRFDFRSLSGNVRSLINPRVRNVGGKARTGRGVDSLDAPTPENMNISVADNGTDEHKTGRLSRYRNHDLQSRRKENGSEDTTAIDGHDLSHYDTALGGKADTIINDTVEHLRIRNFEESPLIHENGHARDADDLKMATFSDDTFPSDHVFVTEEGEKSNKSGIHFEGIKNAAVNKTKSFVSLSEHQEELTSDDLPVLLSEAKYKNTINKEVFTTAASIGENATFYDKYKTIDQVHANSTKNIQENKDRTTIVKQTISSTQEKSKTVISSTESAVFSSTQTTKYIPMQKDGTYEFFTTSSNKALLDNSEDKPNDDSKSLKGEGILKNILPNLLHTSAVTTPDSHMNDPPFRGPNVPQEIDHFLKEKDDTKISYRKPSSTSGSPLSQSLNIYGEWKFAMQTWGIAWECHCYIMGSLFAIVAFYSLISLLRAKTFITLLSTGYYTMTNLIIFFTCLMRAFYLLYDPYNLMKKYPASVSRLLLKITLPCLTSTFCILALALLNYTQTQFLSTKFQRPSVLGVIITFVFSLFVTLEVLAGIMDISILILLACYLVVIFCAGLASMCYFFAFKKLHHRALRRQGEMIRLTFTKLHIDGAQLPKKLPKPTLSLAVKLVLLSAVLQLLLCFLSPYAIVFLRGLFPGATARNPWFWWGYQLTCRILELLMCATMSFVATQPLKHYEIGDGRFCSVLMWFPCSSFSECLRKEDIVDFESHSDNYANPHGLTGDGLNATANSRRLQTNSLPTFRTPLTEVDNNLPMRTLPCSGRHTNYTSALSLLSYYRYVWSFYT